MSHNFVLNSNLDEVLHNIKVVKDPDSIDAFIDELWIRDDEV